MTSKNIERLRNCQDYNTFITMFFGLSKTEQMSVFGSTVTINKGTTLYRIRPYDEKTDFSSAEAWNPPPVEFRNRGRFNEKSDSVLYVATDTVLLEREASIHVGQSYYLGEYIVKDDFEVATFLKNNEIINTVLHKIAMAIESQNKLTEKEQQALKIAIDNGACNDLLSPLSSFVIGQQVKELYRITNKLGKLLLLYNPNGIRYASAFMPMECSGADVCLTLNGEENGNLALTDTGQSHIKFSKSTLKSYSKSDELLTYITVCGEVKTHGLS